MPVYDYKCKQHGLFHELATLADCEKPVPCPTCGTLAGRVIRLPAKLAVLDPATRQAHERNEKSRHEPLILSSAHDRHGKGCGCGDKPRTSTLFYTADGSKMFPSMRPWMISH